MSSGAVTRDGRKLWKTIPLRQGHSNGPLTFLAEIAGNIGLTASFPWVSGLAKNFERYVVHMMNYQYEPSCPSTTAGTLAMCPVYNAGEDINITGKQDVLDRKDTVRTNVWSPATCKLDPKMLNGNSKEHFIRTGPTPTGQDVKTFDKYKMNALVETDATNADATLGELWVDYDIELVNPLPEKDVFVSQFCTVTSFHPSQPSTFTLSDRETDVVVKTGVNALFVRFHQCDKFYTITAKAIASFDFTSSMTFLAPWMVNFSYFPITYAHDTFYHMQNYICFGTPSELPEVGYFELKITFPAVTGGGGGTGLVVFQNVTKDTNSVFNDLDVGRIIKVETRPMSPLRNVC